MLCTVTGCSNRSSRISSSQKNAGKRISFHKFPREPWRREAWVKAINRKNWLPDYKSVVCSEHFPEEHIDRTSLTIVRLRENAVPLIRRIEKKPSRRRARKVDVDYVPSSYSKRGHYKKRKGKLEEKIVETIWHISKPEVRDPLDCIRCLELKQPETSKSVVTKIEPSNVNSLVIKIEPKNFNVDISNSGILNPLDEESKITITKCNTFSSEVAIKEEFGCYNIKTEFIDLHKASDVIPFLQ